MLVALQPGRLYRENPAHQMILFFVAEPCRERKSPFDIESIDDRYRLPTAS